jgi:hypothetical protein
MVISKEPEAENLKTKYCMEELVREIMKEKSEFDNLPDKGFHDV